MNEKRLLFVYNAHSGQEKIKNKLVDILDIFAKAGYEITVRPTQGKEDATKYIKEHGLNYDRIVCCGGDGTLDEAVNALLSLDGTIPLGIIPAGSTNDFGRTLSIPSNMIKAAEVAMTGKECLCDVGQFLDKTFIYIAAFGLLTEVSYETKQEIKNIFGHGAYVLEGMRYLGMKDIKPLEMTIATPDSIIKDRFIYGMITNAASVGGMKARNNEVIKLNDGKFEALFIKYPEDTLELNATLAALLSQEPDPEYMYYFQSESIQISASEPVAWTLDGEAGGAHKEVEIRNLKQAVSLLVPPMAEKFFQ